MLSFPSRTTRRGFFRVGTLGLTGLALPDLLRARAAARSEGRSPRDTSVVWLFLSGGPSHLDTYDLSLHAAVGVDRLRDRRALLATFDSARRDVEARAATGPTDAVERQAFQLLLGKRARDAYDLSLEDGRTVDRYGPGLGEQLLTA